MEWHRICEQATTVGLDWALPTLSKSWMIIILIIIRLYIALNRTPSIDCYLGGSTQGLELSAGFRDFLWVQLG